MLAVIATLSVKDECADEFERFIIELAGQVRENEPGNLTYVVTKTSTQPNTYKIFELYRDQDALEDHGKSAHFLTAGPIFKKTLAARPTIEHLTVLD